MIETLLQLDPEIFLRINRDMANVVFDKIMPLLRNRFFWAPLYLFIIVFCIKEYKKKGYYLILGLLVTFAIGDLTASRIIKPTVQRVRPCNNPELQDKMIVRVPCGTGYSFPSAHATNHFALAWFLILAFHKRWKWIIFWGFAWAAAISFAQIYVGVHYPIDILTGTLLGTIIGISVYFSFKKLKLID
ncbi:MAG: phosphatase PAP2 family protein [Pedobacter sp.]|nr:MAG: phosphatase PAP2 family protein [Pedobacter sp.]